MRRRLRSVLTFLMHQFVGTEGVVWLTVLGGFLVRTSIAELHEPWAKSGLMQGFHLMMSNTPFFPIQIAAGAYFGWRLYRRWRHRSMFWVWILPGLVLAFAVVEIPTFSPWATPVAADTGPMAHYFGWGCQADYRCYDQLTFTEPFYTSVAYSLGALLAARQFQTAPQPLLSARSKGA